MLIIARNHRHSSTLHQSSAPIHYFAAYKFIYFRHECCTFRSKFKLFVFTLFFSDVLALLTSSSFRFFDSLPINVYGLQFSTHKFVFNIVYRSSYLKNSSGYLSVPDNYHRTNYIKYIQVCVDATPRCYIPH